VNAAASYFDARCEQMSAMTEGAGIRRFCYERQAAMVESLVEPGMKVLDVGCGPKLPYRATGAWVVGLDPSYLSLDANMRVNEPICGTAENIPLPDGSVDLVVSFYAVHHMTGRTRAESGAMRRASFLELARVTKPGGEILVFEMVPNDLAYLAQCLGWNTAKRLLGAHLDTLFWSGDEFAHVAAMALPAAHFTEERFDAPWWTTFPPAIGLPWLRVPRLLFPFVPTLYRWRT
jgi:ubiquinone/menaquinone biosynthesis C-methylase UbiE